MAAENKYGHVVMVAYPLYGHHAAFVPLAAMLVQTRPVVVTIISTRPSYIPRLEGEVSRYPLDASLRERIRVVGANIDLAKQDFSLVESVYETLEKAEPVQCTHTEVVHPAVPSPKVVFIDCYAFNPLVPFIRKTSASYDHKVLIYNLQTSFPPFIWRIVAPEDLGGMGDIDAKLSEAGIEANSPEQDEIISSIGQQAEGVVKAIAGVPPMYDYEFFPNAPRSDAVAHQSTIVKVIRHMHTSFLECDASIFTTSEAFAPGVIDEWKKWLNKKGKEVYALYPPSADEMKRKKQTETTTTVTASSSSKRDYELEVEAFLEKAVKDHGKKSLIFISFGTVNWTSEPEKVWLVFDILIEQNIPFIFAHACPTIVVPEEVKEKAKASGLGLVLPWVPQHLVLAHEATGWFLTHCGQNSAVQSLGAGVPMICWPILLDQALVAAHLSLTLKVAYQVYEVRNGEHGLKPLYRFKTHPEEARELTGSMEAVREEFLAVLAKMKSEDGELKRQTAKQIGENMEKEWDEGGAGFEVLKSLEDHAGL